MIGYLSIQHCYARQLLTLDADELKATFAALLDLSANGTWSEDGLSDCARVAYRFIGRDVRAERERALAISQTNAANGRRGAEARHRRRKETASAANMSDRQNTPASDTDSTQPATDSFDRFWAVWPKRLNRKIVHDRWDALSLDQAEAAELMNELTALVKGAWAQADSKDIPSAQIWLADWQKRHRG